MSSAAVPLVFPSSSPLPTSISSLPVHPPPHPQNPISAVPPSSSSVPDPVSEPPPAAPASAVGPPPVATVAPSPEFISVVRHSAPPAQRLSYAQATRAAKGTGFVRSHAVAVEDFAKIPRTGVSVICGSRDGIPSFSFVSSDLPKVEEIYANALVMKFSGGRPSLEVSLKEIQSWGMEHPFSIGPLNSRAFLIRFLDGKDLLKVLTRPSSLLISFPYKIFRWHNLCHLAEDSALAPVWISLPRLPLQCFIPEFLEAIGNRLGRFLCFDKATTTLARPSAARICVELDLRKTPPPFIWIGLFEGCKQAIIYERMPKFCNHCRMRGHTNVVCSKICNGAPSDPTGHRNSADSARPPPARQYSAALNGSSSKADAVHSVRPPPARRNVKLLADSNPQPSATPSAIVHPPEPHTEEGMRSNAVPPNPTQARHSEPDPVSAPPPLINAVCSKCHTLGHYATTCTSLCSEPLHPSSVATDPPTLACPPDARQYAAGLNAVNQLGGESSSILPLSQPPVHVSDHQHHPPHPSVTESPTVQPPSPSFVSDHPPNSVISLEIHQSSALESQCPVPAVAPTNPLNKSILRQGRHREKSVSFEPPGQSNLAANRGFWEAVNERVAAMGHKSVHPSIRSHPILQGGGPNQKAPNTTMFPHSDLSSDESSGSPIAADSPPQSPSALAFHPAHASYASAGEEYQTARSPMLGHSNDDLLGYRVQTSKRNKRHPDQPLKVQLRARKGPNHQPDVR